LRRGVQSECGQERNSKCSDLRTQRRNGLAQPEKSERPIDKEGRALGKAEAAGLVEAFHFEPGGFPAMRERGKKCLFPEEFGLFSTNLRLRPSGSVKLFIR